MIFNKMPKRYHNIDMLKGLAVILMSIVHVNSLFFDNPKGILDIFTLFGATVCFTLFLFAIGYIQGKKIIVKKESSWKSIFKRCIKLYLIYLFVGILSVVILEKTIGFKTILQVIILSKLPLYVEFLISFIWFTLLTKIFYKPIKKLLQKPYLFIQISILIYLLGMILYSINVDSSVLIWFKTHLAGHSDIHVFPVLQYLPIYILGLVMGKHGNEKTYFLLSILSLFIFLGIDILNCSGWYRWPPSMLFLMEGVLTVFIFMYIFDFMQSLKVFKPLKDIGKSSLNYLVFLTVFSIISTLFISPISDSWIVILLNVVILVISWFCVKMLNRLKM